MVRRLISGLFVAIFALMAGGEMSATAATEPPPPIPAAETVGERLVFLDTDELATLRKQWKSGKKSSRLTNFLAGADKALSAPIPLITDKKEAPVSGNKNDYYSIGIYWWPNPLTKGKPYIRRDGRVNPESNLYDRPRLVSFARNTLALSRAFAFTGDQRYAAKAHEAVQKWLINPATRMNPHFRYAQAWPGLTDGSPSGIIEGSAFAESAPDAVTLLYQYGVLSPAEYETTRRWFTDLAEWLEKDPMAIKIGTAANNHGYHYDLQRCAYRVFLGESAKVRAILQAVGPDRIAVQIRPDGTQPAELERTQSFEYSCYSLSALTRLAELGTRFGVDLWHYQAPDDGGSIRKALGYLVPYALGEKPWTYETIHGFKPVKLIPLLRRATPAFPDADYPAVIRRIEAAAPSPQPSGK